MTSIRATKKGRAGAETFPVFEIQPLRKAHEREEFDCGDDDLNRYLKRSARQNQDKDVGRTYVAVEEGQLRVLGYYTLSSASIEFSEYPEGMSLPRYPIPAILLARIAVDKRLQGQGILGPDLLIHALKTAQMAADSIAAVAVITEAKDERVQRFYEKYGFMPLNKQGRHLYLPMKQIRKLP